MRNNIKSSSYYSIFSCVHEMNPLIKIICSFIFFLIIILAKTIWLNLILLVILLINILLTNIPIKVYIDIVKKSLWFIALIFLINLIFFSLYTNAILCLKYLEVIIYACLICITTKPLKILKSFNIMLAPLKLIGIPVYSISFLILYFFQYIYNIFSLNRVINKSQKSKGIISIFKQIKYKTIPLFVLDGKNNSQLDKSISVKIYDIDWQNNYSLKFKMTIYDTAFLILYIFVLILTFKVEV